MIGDFIEREDFYMPPHAPAHLKRARPVNPERLTKAQRRVLNQFDGVEIGFVSNAPIWGRPFRYLKKTDHRILIALLMGGALELWKVRGPLPGDHPPSTIGADADYHYKLVKPHHVVMARGPDGFATGGWEYRPNPSGGAMRIDYIGTPELALLAPDTRLWFFRLGREQVLAWTLWDDTEDDALSAAIAEMGPQRWNELRYDFISAEDYTAGDPSALAREFYRDAWKATIEWLYDEGELVGDDIDEAIQVGRRIGVSWAP